MLQKGTEMTHLAETHSICQVQPDYRHERDAHPQQAVQSVWHQCENDPLQQPKHDVEDTGELEPFVPAAAVTIFCLAPLGGLKHERSLDQPQKPGFHQQGGTH